MKKDSLFLSILVFYIKLATNQTGACKTQYKIHIDEALCLQAICFPDINNKKIVISDIGNLIVKQLYTVSITCNIYIQLIYIKHTILKEYI